MRYKDFIFRSFHFLEEVAVKISPGKKQILGGGLILGIKLTKHYCRNIIVVHHKNREQLKISLYKAYLTGRNSFLYARNRIFNYLIWHQSYHHRETSKLICRANQLTDVYMMAILAFELILQQMKPWTLNVKHRNIFDLLSSGDLLAQS